MAGGMNGTWASELFGSIVAGAIQNDYSAETDYVGEDGRKYCGLCHTPKESRLPNIVGREGETRIPCLCKCMAQKYEREEKERKELEWRERTRKLLLGDKFSGATFENAIITAENEKPLKTCRKYAEKFPLMQEMNQGLLLMGPQGTGKTYAASCIINRLIDDGKRCMFASAVDMAKELNAYALEGCEAYERRIANADLLVIDDFGAERKTEYSTERMYKAINTRYAAQKPMVLTTNITASKDFFENATQQQARIYDRLFENCTPVVFSGKSWRVRMASKKAKELSAVLGLEE